MLNLTHTESDYQYLTSRDFEITCWELSLVENHQGTGPCACGYTLCQEKGSLTIKWDSFEYKIYLRLIVIISCCLIPLSIKFSSIRWPWMIILLAFSWSKDNNNIMQNFCYIDKFKGYWLSWIAHFIIDENW